MVVVVVVCDGVLGSGICFAFLTGHTGGVKMCHVAEEIKHTEDITTAAAVERAALEDVDEDAHGNGHAANDVHVGAKARVVPSLAQHARIKNWSEICRISRTVVRQLSSDDTGNGARHDKLRKRTGERGDAGDAKLATSR
jgi:hypothetical protein